MRPWCSVLLLVGQPVPGGGGAGGGGGGGGAPAAPPQPGQPSVLHLLRHLQPGLTGLAS